MLFRSAIVDGGYFRNYIGVSVASAYSADNETATAAKHALVRGARFDALDVRPSPLHPPAAITMNYRMATGDPEPRDPILVERFNDTPGDDFAVFYSLDAPPRNAPCQQRRAAIAGWACAPGR